jgi:hypothetical protein
MIIDAHNHMGGPDKGDGYSQSPDEIVARMDKAGVDLAVVFPFNEVDPGMSFSKANDRIAEGVKKYPDRLIGFCRLDPHFEDKAIKELRRSVEELGLLGVKLHPTGQNFEITDPMVIEIAREASTLNVPLVFDTGKKQSQPWMVGELAKEAPEAVIIMAHLRGEGSIDVAREYENVYQGTTKAFKVEKVKEALEVLGPEKLIAGSDSPYADMKAAIDIFDFASAREKRLICGGNIKNILGL